MQRECAEHRELKGGQMVNVELELGWAVRIKRVSRTRTHRTLEHWEAPWKCFEKWET